MAAYTGNRGQLRGMVYNIQPQELNPDDKVTTRFPMAIWKNVIMDRYYAYPLDTGVTTLGLPNLLLGNEVWQHVGTLPAGLEFKPQMNVDAEIVGTLAGIEVFTVGVALLRR